MDTSETNQSNMKKLIIFGSTIMLCLGVFALKSLLNGNVADILKQNIEALAQISEEEEAEEDGKTKCYKTICSYGDGPAEDIVYCTGCEKRKAKDWSDRGKC